MPPILYLVRHGEGEHNVNDSHHLRDAHLTETGKTQCRDLRDNFPYHDEVSLILASPLRRTIQTAAHSFQPVLEKRQVPFVLVPKAQEISKQPCDIGQDSDVLKAEIPGLITPGAACFDQANLDTSLLEDGWNSKKGIYAPTSAAVRKRAAELRTWLWRLPHEHVVLVTHGAFLHYLTEDWTFYDRQRGTGYRNCEYRRFTFTEDSSSTEAHLLEVGGSSVKVDRPLGVDIHVLHEVEEVEAAK
ncbi:hypothetical protein N7520_007553 [Penicillium odoratum]|uniref:uncharacterized protein n=1 Tax=Penicillium odoratum TaxID=1167516 RepID=UPI002548CBCF|nr:uncharacterized protein N7520_007553 [Penicillium odoratum]KAJ5760397.1 hypothetical protein N7520_007553 [Penicillium odoratum]